MEGIDLKLVVELSGHGGRVFGEQRLPDVEALFAEHDGGEGGHGMLDFFGCEHAEALCCVVDAVPDFGEVSEGAFVVLCFEAEVALAHDDDFGELEHDVGADAVDVSQDELELLRRL